MRKLFTFITAVLLVAVYGSVATPAPAPLKVVAMELTPTEDPSLSFFRMAAAMDIYKQYGLDPVIKAAGGGGPAKVQALVAGEADVAVSDIIAAFSAVYEGTDVRVIFVPTARYGSPIFAQKDYKTLADAKGKQWGIASLGGSQRFYSTLVVRALGLSEKDYLWQAVGGSATAVPALVNRRVEVATITPTAAPLIRKMADAGNVHTLIQNTAKFTPPFPNFVIIARNRWVERNAEAAERLVAMFLDASRQWSSRPDSWLNPSAKIFKALNREELTDVYKTIAGDGYFAENGGINYKATQTVLDLYFEVRGDRPNKELGKGSDVFNTGPLKRVLDRKGVIKGSRDEPDWYQPSP